MDMLDGEGETDPESLEAVDVLFDKDDTGGGGLRIVRFFESKLTVRKLFVKFAGFACCNDSALAVVLLSDVFSRRGRLEGRGMLPFVSIPLFISWMLTGRARMTEGGRNFERNCAISLPTLFCCVAGALLLLLLEAVPSLARAKRFFVGTGYFSIAALRRETMLLPLPLAACFSNAACWLCEETQLPICWL